MNGWGNVQAKVSVKIAYFPAFATNEQQKNTMKCYLSQKVSNKKDSLDFSSIIYIVTSTRTHKYIYKTLFM